jgi:Flp pilus assembly protein TadD
MERAIAQHQSGRLLEAASAYRELLQTRASDPVLLNNLGNVLAELQRLKEAEQCYRQALIAGSQFAEIHSNLGKVLVDQGRAQEAENICRRAIALKPEYAGAHQNLGYALQQVGRLEEAEQCHLRALAVDPEIPGAYANLGNIYRELGRAIRAEECFGRALALKPDDAMAHCNLGVLLYELGRMDEAKRSFLQAQALKPDLAVAHGYEGIVQLMAGDMLRGWEKYEWRRKDRKNGPVQRSFPEPEWTGSEDLRGRTILLYSEQGLGDTIMFLRYVPLVANRGGNVLLEIPRALVALTKNIQGAHQVVAYGEPLPRFDLHCPLLSLPLAFKTTRDQIPSTTPYLKVDEDAVARWRIRLSDRRERKLVGVCWRGNPDYKRDKERSIHLRQLIPIFGGSDALFVSLQKELSDSEQAAVAGVSNFIHVGADFANTAEIVGALDLVITVDTAWAHWAGAIGKRVWGLLPRMPHLCWLLERLDSPWYPAARLFRQQERGDWDDVIRRVKRDLEREAQWTVAKRPTQ